MKVLKSLKKREERNVMRGEEKERKGGGKMKLYTEPVSIKYDEFVRSCENSWLIRIDKKNHFFPFSLCTLDEESKEIICPMWMAVEKEVDAYAVL